MTPDNITVEFLKTLRPPREDGSTPYFDYSDFDSLIGDVVVSESDSDYQGETIMLIRDPDSRRYTVHWYSWGSCSGCDALQACTQTYEAYAEFAKAHIGGLSWHQSIDEAIAPLIAEQKQNNEGSWPHSDRTLDAFIAAAQRLAALRELKP